MNNGLTKTERLTSQLVIDKLFAGGNASMAAFPLRIVYMQMEKQEGSQQLDGVQQPPVSILVSVPKKRFRHAVDRNRMTRLVREAYLRNKHILWNALQEKNFRLAIAFVCITDTLPTFRTVNKSVTKALIRVAERLEG